MEQLVEPTQTGHCITLASHSEGEFQFAPWNPMAHEAQAQVKMTNGDGGEASRPNRPRPGLDLPASQTNLLLELLALYAADPQLIVTRGFDASDDPAQILRMVSSLMVNPSSAQIRSASAKLNCAVLNFLAGSGASASEDQETAVFVAACSDWLCVPGRTKYSTKLTSSPGGRCSAMPIDTSCSPSKVWISSTLTTHS